MILQDYIVAYEGDCDPYSEICFVDCEDEECTTEYYYTIIERKAYEISELCGPNVTECDDAYECQPEVEFCEIYYCDPEVDGEDYCEYLEGSARPAGEGSEEFLEITTSTEEVLPVNSLSTTTTGEIEVEQEKTNDTDENGLVNLQEL